MILMVSNKRYKFRIYPNKEQSNLINKTFGCVRFLYNQMLADKIKYYKETKKRLKSPYLSILNIIRGYINGYMMWMQ